MPSFPKLKYDTLLTEDSKSGYQFYQHYFKDDEIKCFSSDSNFAIFKWLKENEDKKVFVIADGAAFGSEIDRIKYLIEITVDTPFQYAKREINQVYLLPVNSEKIISEIYVK